MIDGLSKEKQDEIYQFVAERFIRQKDKRDDYDDRVETWIRLYNSVPLDNKEEWQHNIFVPLIYGTVETIKPRIVASIFNDPNYLSVQATDKSFMNAENRIRDWYMYKLDEMEFDDKYKECIEDCLVYPTSWMKVLVNQDSEGGNRVNMEKVDYLDVWVDFAYSRKLTDVFHRIESNSNKVGALIAKKVYECDEEVFETLSGNFDQEIPDKKAKLESLFASLGNKGTNLQQEKKEAGRLNKIELIEWWGTYDYKGDGIDRPIVVTLANRKVGLRIDTYLDGIPFFMIRNGKNTRINYGRPIAQQLEGLQEELNDKRSKRFDNLDRLLNLMYKARRTATIDWDNLFSAPDNVLLMDDIHNDLEIIRADPIPRAAYEEENYIKADAQFVSGGQDFNSQGIVGAKGTATGISAILSESATRFRTTVEDIVSDTIPLLEYVFVKIKRYSTENESIRIFDTQDWQDITTGDLKGNYRLKVGISNITTVNKELRIQLLINLLNIVGRLEGMANIGEFVKRILQLADIKNVDKIMGDEPSTNKTNKVKKIRGIFKKLKDKRQKTIDDPLEGGADGVINRILAPPIAPTAPQLIQSPQMSILSNILGNQTLGQ